MNEGLHCIYSAVSNRLPKGYTFADYEQAMKEWQVVPLKADDEIIGGVLIKGNEIHVAYSSHPGFSMRSHIRMTMNKLLDQYGSVVTRVMQTNDRGRSFCRRMGFEVTGIHGGIINMICTRKNYV